MAKDLKHRARPCPTPGIQRMDSGSSDSENGCGSSMGILRSAQHPAGERRSSSTFPTGERIMPEPTRVIIADDHPIFRSGLLQILAPHESMHVCAEVSDGLSAL